MNEKIDHETYWRRHRRRILILLLIWFLVGPVMSILLIEPLNNLVIGGVPFGFWMAQQGSVIVFVCLIFYYAIASGRLDRQAGVHEADEGSTEPGAAH